MKFFSLVNNSPMKDYPANQKGNFIKFWAFPIFCDD